MLIIDARQGPIYIKALKVTTQVTKGTHIRNPYRGPGVIMRGPGTVTLESVDLDRTSSPGCLSAALDFAGPPLKVILRRSIVQNHSCYLAGAWVVTRGVNLHAVQSTLRHNHGQLAGAVLVEGGSLNMELTDFEGNRNVRADDGHHLTISAISTDVPRVVLNRVRFKSVPRKSIYFDGRYTPDVSLRNMNWPEKTRPDFVSNTRHN